MLPFDQEDKAPHTTDKKINIGSGFLKDRSFEGSEFSKVLKEEQCISL